MPTLGLHSLDFFSLFQTSVFLGFSIISVLFGLGLIVIYGFFIVFLWDIAALIPVQITIASILLTLGISEVVTGIWSAVCCCRSCCAATPSELVSLFCKPHFIGILVISNSCIERFHNYHGKGDRWIPT